MRFEYEEALFRLELLAGEKLPEIAYDMLDAGYDTQPIRELAGLTRPTRRDAGPLFEEALEAVRPQPMSVERAREVVRDRLLDDIATGSLEPMAGAAMLNHQWNDLGCPADLSVFIYLTDIADDYPERRSEAAAEIVQLARTLVHARINVQSA